MGRSCVRCRGTRTLAAASPSLDAPASGGQGAACPAAAPRACCSRWKQAACTCTASGRRVDISSIKACQDNSLPPQASAPVQKLCGPPPKEAKKAHTKKTAGGLACFYVLWVQEAFLRLWHGEPQPSTPDARTSITSHWDTYGDSSCDQHFLITTR